MNIVYIISIIILYLTIILIKKDNNKHNFIFTNIFLIGILYCFNILLISLLSFIRIGSNFLILSILNIVFSLIIFFIYYKKNSKKIQLQRYIFNWKEITFAVFIVVICFIIGYIRFGGFNSISYETTDPAVHYRSASSFSDNFRLLTSEISQDEMYGSFDGAIPGFSLNCGIFIKTFSFISSYKAYMIFDVIVLCLLALIFYATCLKIKKVKNNEFISFIITCLYFTAYCLNNLIFGFGYLGIGVLSINLIMLTWILYENKNISKKIFIPLLFLFNFTLFFSYYLFVPTVYLAQGLYIIYKWIKKEYSFLELIKIGMFTLILPFILGFVYFVYPSFLGSSTTVSATSAIAMEGYIYRDLWSNFILIVPLVIFSIILELKSKKISFIFFFYVIEFIYILLTFILGLKGYVSSYYYYKAYYIFWLFNYIYIIKLINLNNKNANIAFKLYIFYIVFIILISLSNIEYRIYQKNILFNNAIVSQSYGNIYLFNKNKICQAPIILSAEELKIVDKVVENKEKCINNKEIPVIGDVLKKLWFYSITEIVPFEDHKTNELGRFYDEKFDYLEWEKNKDSKCLVIFNSSNNPDSENYIEINYDNYEILYKNNSGYIIKKQS